MSHDFCDMHPIGGATEAKGGITRAKNEDATAHKNTARTGERDRPRAHVSFFLWRRELRSTRKRWGRLVGSIERGIHHTCSGFPEEKDKLERGKQASGQRQKKGEATAAPLET